MHSVWYDITKSFFSCFTKIDFWIVTPIYENIEVFWTMQFIVHLPTCSSSWMRKHGLLRLLYSGAGEELELGRGQYLNIHLCKHRTQWVPPHSQYSSSLMRTRTVVERFEGDFRFQSRERKRKSPSNYSTTPRTFIILTHYTRHMWTPYNERVCWGIFLQWDRGNNNTLIWKINLAAITGTIILFLVF